MYNKKLTEPLNYAKQQTRLDLNKNQVDGTNKARKFK